MELAKRSGQGPTKISAIAKAQAIPQRFLEVILHQLKGSGLVNSKRGFCGGYQIAKSPDQISVGDVLRHVHKEQVAGDCLACISRQDCPFIGRCVFSALWAKVFSAVYEVYDATSLQDLLNGNYATALLNELNRQQKNYGTSGRQL